MHTSYTIEVTTGQYKALQYVMIDQQDWTRNVLHDRARIATDEIVSLYTRYKVNKGETITAIGSTAIVEAAYAEGVVGIAT